MGCVIFALCIMDNASMREISLRNTRQRSMRGPRHRRATRAPPDGTGAPASNGTLGGHRMNKCQEREMPQDLARFPTETAHDTAARARVASDAERTVLTNEVEELMALRARLLARHQASEQANQLQLPLTAKAA